MNKLIVFIFFFFLLFPLFGQAEKFYRWTDDQGNVYFSDQPHPGAENISPSNTQTYQPVVPKVSKALLPDQEKVTEQDEKKWTGYQEVRIIQPEPLAHIYSGTLNVLVIIKPKLQPTHRIVLYMDDVEAASTQTEQMIKIYNVDRGTHQLSVKILDQAAQIIAQSERVSVHVHRPQVKKLPSKPTSNQQIRFSWKNLFGVTVKTG